MKRKHLHGKKALQCFLVTMQPDNGRLYADLSRIKPRFNSVHKWFRCEQCSEITPYLLKKDVLYVVVVKFIF